MELGCLKCGHEWISRNGKPIACPSCNSRYWNSKDYQECMICKRNFIILHVHHIDRNRKNNSKENLLEICASCHSFIHAGDKNTRRRVRIMDFKILEKIEFYKEKILAKVRK